MNLKNHLNQQYPAVFIMALTIFDFKKDMSCPTSELRSFFLPHGGDRPKKKGLVPPFPEVSVPQWLDGDQKIAKKR